MNKEDNKLTQKPNNKELLIAIKLSSFINLVQLSKEKYPF